MKIKPTQKVGTWAAYLDDDGLTSKGIRTKILQTFVRDINNKIADIIFSMDVELITDPAIVVSPKYFPFIEQIVRDSVDEWEKIRFPTKDTLLIRTTGFDSKYAFPHTETSLRKDISAVVADIRAFLEKENPRQIIMHPRLATEKSMSELVGIRSQSVPGDVHIQIGKGGQGHINRLEGTLLNFEFDYINKPSNLPEDFNIFTNSLAIITPVADAIYAKSNPDSNVVPVYELKGVEKDGRFILNMFDYET